MRNRVAYSLVVLAVAILAWIAILRLAVGALITGLDGNHIQLYYDAQFLRFVPGGKRAALPRLLAALQSPN